MISEQIVHAVDIRVNSHEPVYGGDINQCYCLHGPDKKYFLKLNKAEDYPGMFAKEANGLIALKENGNLIVPEVIKQGTVGSYQFLLLEWLDSGQSSKLSWRNFGKGLAQIHKKPEAQFGWIEDNYIGSLVQKNNFADNWPGFYAEYRIRPLSIHLRDKKAFDKEDLDHAEILCSKLDQLFPAEPAALLHGDLWSGNYKFIGSGGAAIFDPAVYYGHREMDLGMSLLFGGFDAEFYEGYNEEYPLEKGWRERVPLTQLYPLLVHAVLFGGHYVDAARKIIKKFSI